MNHALPNTVPPSGPIGPPESLIEPQIEVLPPPLEPPIEHSVTPAPLMGKHGQGWCNVDKDNMLPGRTRSQQ